jgi:hypothetical protein
MTSEDASKLTHVTTDIVGNVYSTRGPQESQGLRVAAGNALNTTQGVALLRQLPRRAVYSARMNEYFTLGTTAAAAAKAELKCRWFP